MKRLLLFLCAMVLAFSYVGIASADTAVFLSGVSSSSGYNDVEQAPYGNLCWAATASNMLAYENWNGGTALQTASQIFNQFSTNMYNVEGNPYFAVNTWLSGADYAAHSKNSMGGFYPTVGISSVYGFDENQSDVNSTLKTWIKDNVTNGVVGTILLGAQVSGKGVGIHFLTYWGYDKDASNNVTGVWITDSFDGVTIIKDEALSADGSGHWQLADYKDLGYVISAARLNPNLPYTAPTNPVDTCTPGVTCPCTGPDCTPTGVPEPATLILLGSGLFGLFLVRKRS